MSMIGYVLGLTQKQISAIQDDPSLANDIAMVAQEEAMAASHQRIMERLPPERQAAAEERRRAMHANPVFVEAEREMGETRSRIASLAALEPALDLQKSWHVLHYVLTGDVGPVGSPGDALLMGEDMGEDKFGYGPPRLHTPEATREFANFLVTFDSERIQSRLNYRHMKEIQIYSLPIGLGAEAEFESDIRREISSYFPMLKDYVSGMAAKGNGLLMWIS